MTQKNEESTKQEGAGRKTYTSPELTEYGSILRLTKGGLKSAAADHGANMMRL